MGKASITIAVGALWDGNKTISKVSSDLAGMAKRVSQLDASNTASLANFGSKWETVGGKIYDAGKKIADVGDNLTKRVTVPMAALGGYCVSQATTFDTALAGLNKTADLTAEELENFGQKALEASKTSPVTAAEILDAEALGAQLGISTEALQDFADVATGLDISTDLDMETAATQMAQFANITGMSEDELANYGSTIVGLGNNLATTESSISNMSLRLAGITTVANFSSAEVLGLAGAMSSLGINAEAGGSAMTTIISNISTGVAEGGEELENYARVAGTTAEEFAAKWESSPMEAIEMLVSGTDRLTESGENISDVMSDLGISGIRQTDVWRRLSGQSEVLADAIDLANTSWEENTALTTEVSKRNESIESRFETLGNKVNAAATQVGTVLAEALLDAADAFSPVIEAVGNAADAFYNLDSPTQTAITTLAGIAAASGPVLSVTGRLVEGVGNVTSKFGEAQSTFAVYGDALTTVDGSQMRVYASTDSLSTSLGIAGNAAAKAAGGADNYVEAWETMTKSAGTYQKKQEKLAETMDELASITDVSTKKSQKKKAALEETAKSLAKESDEALKNYQTSSKQVTAWSKSTSEAEKAANGNKKLTAALKSTTEGMEGLNEETSALSTAGSAASGVVSTLWEGIKQMAGAAAISLAIAGVTAAVGYLAEQYIEMKERQELVDSAMQSSTDIIAAHSGEVGSLASAYTNLEPDITGTYEAMAQLNEEFGTKLDEVNTNNALLGIYTDTIEELGNKGNLTAAEQEKLKQAVQGYNDITGESIEITDLASGALSDSIQNIRAQADAWAYNAKQQAFQQQLTSIYQEQATAQVNLSKAKQQSSDAQEKLNAWEQEHADIMDKITGKTDPLWLEQNRDLVNEHGALAGAVKNANDQLTEAQSQYDKLVENGNDLQAVIDENAEGFADLQGALSGFGDSTTAELDKFSISTDTAAAAMANAGISAKQLNKVGSENFNAWMEEANGDIDTVIARIRLYGNEPLVDKDGNITVDQTQLTDANGNIYTYNNGILKDKNGNIVIDQTQLTDANGNLVTYQALEVNDKTATVSINGAEYSVDLATGVMTAIENIPDESNTDIKTSGAETAQADATNTTTAVNGIPDYSNTTINQSGAEGVQQSAFLTKASLNNIPKNNNSIISETGAAGVMANASSTKVSLDRIPKNNVSRISETGSSDVRSKSQWVKTSLTGLEKTFTSKVSVTGTSSALSSIGSVASALRGITGSFTTRITQIVSQVKKADGGFVLRAATGGVKVRKLAHGSIVSNPGPGVSLYDTRVGEDGAEAIVPLTNKRYAMPFVRMISNETAQLMNGGGAGKTYNLYINGTQINGSAHAKELVEALFNEFGLTAEMGA